MEKILYLKPYREVNGYPIKVKAGAQEKHIPDTPNYKQELANGKIRAFSMEIIK